MRIRLSRPAVAGLRVEKSGSKQTGLFVLLLGDIVSQAIVLA
jgi:hypothetical protein